MNCQSFQENLYEYLDETLSPAQLAAAKAHLVGCDVCRAAVKREQQLAQILSGGLERIAEAVTLETADQQRLAAAVQRKIAPAPARPHVPFWKYLISPYAVSALLIIAIFAAHFFLAGHHPKGAIARAPETKASPDVQVNLSYCAPSYIFRREGNFVVDALTCDPRTANETLVAKN
jgi:anti-sigma factor RsiW